MSVNIRIDRFKTLEALLRQYNVVPFFRFSFGESEHTDVIYRDGWFFVDLKIDGKYPAVTYGKVHAMLPHYGTDGSVVMVYVHELREYFYHFFEVEKAEYQTYIGIDLLNNGSVKYENRVRDTSVTLLPPGSVQPGDTLLSGLYLWNDGGTLKVRILIRRVDFDNRTLVPLVDFTDPVNYPYHVVSAYGLEPKGSKCKFGISFYATGPIQYFYDIAPYLLKYGLPDPRLINPWR